MSKGLLAILLAVLPPAMGCNVFLPSQFQSDRVSESATAQAAHVSRAAFEAKWVGKQASDVQKAYGPPSQMETLEDTGGKRFYYREDGEPHCVFEVSPQGKVISAALVK
jgi:hypothetical protein